MNQIKAMADHYAVINGGQVVGVITADGHGMTTWSFHPLTGSGCFYATLQSAMDAAKKHGHPSSSF